MSRRLFAALLSSLAIHGALLLAATPSRPLPAQPRLEARLKLREQPTPAQETVAPREAPPEPVPATKKPPQPQPRQEKSQPARFKEPPASINGYPVLRGSAARNALSQLARQPLYPPEAISRGLQGEVLLLLLLDGEGNVLAARVEQSSGHPLLDQAAVQAARQLKALPEGAPRETILPVRFRLD